MVKGFLGTACHIQLYSSFLFFSPSALLSRFVSRSWLSDGEGRGKKILSEPTKSFCKGLQDYLLLRGPSYTQTSLSFVSGWSLGSEADVLIQSAANSSNALLPPKTHSSHFTDTITSRAALAILLWLYVFTWAGRCLLWKQQPPSCCPLSYRRERAAVRFHLFIIYGREFWWFSITLFRPEPGPLEMSGSRFSDTVAPHRHKDTWVCQEQYTLQPYLHHTLCLLLLFFK